jgi:dephospho-CoA kinase
VIARPRNRYIVPARVVRAASVARIGAQMFVLGLTGSVGMGKSTAAGFFAEEGVPVHDADAAVHRLYAGEAAPLIEAAFPGTTVGGAVDRTRLATRVLGDPAALKQLEAIVHPLVQASERRFLEDAKARGEKVVVLDIPLLFETGGEERVDAVVVVSAPPEVQRARVLGRPGMTAQKLDAILAQQMPDAEKRRRADFVVDTSQSFDAARAQIRAVLAAVATMPIRRK